MNSVQLIGRLVFGLQKTQCRNLSISVRTRKQHYQLLIAGGGTAGTAMSSKFSRKLGKGRVALIEPKENLVVTNDGTEITYDFLIIALGLEPRFDKIKGLTEGFDTPGICSVYDPRFVLKTFPAIQNFNGFIHKTRGNAIFTMPFGAIKCAGANHSIMFAADERFRINGVRQKANILFNSALDCLLPSPKVYADSIMEAVQRKNITFNKRHNLVEVRPDNREAVFRVMGEDANSVGKTKTFPYEFLHVCPPCFPVKEVSENKELTNDAGWVTVDKHTLQHTRFDNIFGLGDCADLPTNRTGAAVSCQGGVVRKNLEALMAGKAPITLYDGYTSCPVLTSSNTVIMAEFGYSHILKGIIHNTSVIQ